MRRLKKIHGRIRRRAVATMTRLLTQPLRSYEQRIPNDMKGMKASLRVGDVLLVEGDQRVSQVIRYLTQSSWSHCALYIGDELRRLCPDLATALAADLGNDARHLLIEALDGKGVICVPLSKYEKHNLRVCRPRNLRRDDLDRILSELVAQLGRPYSIRHVVALALYFFPVSLIPGRFRRTALNFKPDQTLVCSTMLARAFARVGYPVLPRVTLADSPVGIGWVDRVLRRNGNGRRAVYEPEDPALITPRDFDLSPYFDVLKLHLAATTGFDYRRIEWTNGNHPSAGTAEEPGREDLRHAS